MRTLAPFLGLLLLAPSPACDPNPDSELEDGGEDASGNGCVETITVLNDLHAPTALGFSPNQLIALAEGQHGADMVWGTGIDESIAKVSFGPESGEATLTVVIDHGAGEVRYVHSEPEAGEELLDGPGSGCSDRVEVDVEVMLASSGGGFAEIFTAPLQASTARVAFVRHELELAELAGNFTLTEVEPEDVKVGPLALDLGIFAGGLFGGVTSVVEVTDGEITAATFMDVARWPVNAAACEYGEVPVGPADDFAAFSAADVHALVSSAAGLQIAWDGGAPQSLMLGLAELPADAIACAVYEGEVIGQLRFPVELTVSSGDERWSGSFPVELQGIPAADGTLASAVLHIPAAYANSVAAGDFLATYGIADVDLAGFDRAIVDLLGEFTPAEGGATANGSLKVVGVVSNSCPPDANGCAGDDYTDLVSAVWGDL